MATAEYNYEDFQPNAQSKADEGLLVRFYPQSVQDNIETQKQGRPVFKEIDICEIRVPGDKSFVAHPATQKDLDRFPRHWQAYKNRTQGQEYIEGTLLAEWPLVTRSQVDELAFANIKTVEQLVAAPDSNIAHFMGMNVLKQKAREWLDNAAEGKAKAELKAELDERDQQIAELQAQMKELMAAKKPKVTKKKTARKKKVSAKKE